MSEQPTPMGVDRTDLDLDTEGALHLLRHGELSVVGRLVDASNATLYCTVTLDDLVAPCVHKPIAGERPLWDFPDGTLAHREVAAYVVSEATGWGVVPPTVMRDGPFGPGMCQRWIDSADDVDLVGLLDADARVEGWRPVVDATVEDGREVTLAHRDDERLRRIVVFDAVVNNADRKGGHLLPTADGHVYGVDHGLCFSTAEKLRTLLWGWHGEPLTDEAVGVLSRLAAELLGGLGERLGELLAPAEVEATRGRVEALLRRHRYPEPAARWPAVPWPPI